MLSLAMKKGGNYFNVLFPFLECTYNATFIKKEKGMLPLVYFISFNIHHKYLILLIVSLDTINFISNKYISLLTE